MQEEERYIVPCYIYQYFWKGFSTQPLLVSSVSSPPWHLSFSDNSCRGKGHPIASTGLRIWGQSLLVRSLKEVDLLGILHIWEAPSLSQNGSPSLACSQSKDGGIFSEPQRCRVRCIIAWRTTEITSFYKFEPRKFSVDKNIGQETFFYGQKTYPEQKHFWERNYFTRKQSPFLQAVLQIRKLRGN